MALTRISTYALHQSTLNSAVRTQVRLAELQSQISSGLKTDSFEGIATQAEQFVTLDNKLSRIRVYLEQNIVVDTRLQTTGVVLDQVIETATALKNSIIQRRSSATGQNSSFPEQIDAYWQSLAAQLNTSIGGRYLFSGTRTDSPPVDVGNFPQPVVPGAPDAGYYQGSPQDISAQIDDGVSMTYSVRADDEAFQNILAGLSLASSGDAGNSDADLARAYDLVDEGLKQVISLQATVNSNKLALDQTNVRHAALQTYWKGIKESVINTDLLAASTQVAIDQGLLQASFQAFASINSLRLSDFLR